MLAPEANPRIAAAAADVASAPRDWGTCLYLLDGLNAAKT